MRFSGGVLVVENGLLSHELSKLGLVSTLHQCHREHASCHRFGFILGLLGVVREGAPSYERQLSTVEMGVTMGCTEHLQL